MKVVKAIEVTGAARLGTNLPSWVAANLAPDGLTEAAGRLSVNSANANADLCLNAKGTGTVRIGSDGGSGGCVVSASLTVGSAATFNGAVTIGASATTITHAKDGGRMILGGASVGYWLRFGADTASDQVQYAANELGYYTAQTYGHRFYHNGNRVADLKYATRGGFGENLPSGAVLDLRSEAELCWAGNRFLVLSSNNPERGPWNPLWSYLSACKPLYFDEEFASGVNSVNVYNNYANYVDSVSVTAAGSGYTSCPSVGFSGGSGSGAAATCNLKAVSATVAGGGSGYQVGDYLTVVGGTYSSTASLYVSAVSAGAVTGVSVYFGGAYSALPGNPVSVTGGSGSGAQFNLTWGVNAVTMATKGNQYTSAPTVSFTGGGGSGAAGTAVLKNAVTITRETGQSGVPNSTSCRLRIVYDGTPSSTSPGLGGFVQTIVAAANKTIVQRFRALLPAGFNLAIAENSQGTNNTSYWLTSAAGTGKWEDYIRVSHCGNSGTFSSGGHVYVVGSGTVTWYLAACNAYEVNTPWWAAPVQLSSTLSIGATTSISSGTTLGLKITTSSAGPWAIQLVRSDQSNNTISVFNNSGQWCFDSELRAPRLLVDAGTAGTPSFNFGAASDADTGVYRSAADELSVATGGVQRAAFGNAGLFLYHAYQPYSNWSQCSLLTTDTYASDKGGALMLGGRYHADGSYAGFAAVAGRKENGTSGDTGGYLSLASRANGGAVTEQWRITSSGVLQSTGAQTIQSGSGLLTITGTGGLSLGAGANNITCASKLVIAADLECSSGRTLRLDAGTVASPALNFGASGDGDTGLYLPAADSIGWVITGAIRCRLTTTDLLVGTMSPPSTLEGSWSTGGSIPNGYQYYWCVTALDAFGETVASTDYGPSAPGSGYNTVTLTWLPVAGATGYKLYRRRSTESWTDANPHYLGTVSGELSTSYTDSASSPGTGSPPTTTSAWAARTALSSGRLTTQQAGIGQSADANYALTVIGNPGAKIGLCCLGRSANGYAALGDNVRFTKTGGAYKYDRSGDYATLVDFASGHIAFRTAPTGTAGNTITFTTRLRVTNAGNIEPSASIVPTASGSYDLGSSSQKFNNAHANSVLAYTRLNIPVVTGVPTLNDGDVAIGDSYYGTGLFYRKGGITYVVVGTAA